MFTIIEESDSCPLAGKCKQEAEQREGVKTTNYTRDSNKNAHFLEIDSCAKKDDVSGVMNVVESSPIELNRGRSRRGAVVKDSDADDEDPAILSDIGHVQHRGRSRRGAVVKDSDVDDEDSAILSDIGHVHFRGRSRRGAVVKKSDADDEDSAILSDIGHVQHRGRSRRGAVVKDSDADVEDPAVLSDNGNVQYRGRSRRGAVVKDSGADDEDPTILSDTGQVRTSKESVLFKEHFYQKTKELENSSLGVKGSRSKSCPNSELYGSMPDVRPHHPLLRTISMDSVRLKEWLTSYTDKLTLSNSSLPTLPRQAFSSQDEIKSHSSLPSHIQRAFPELTTPPTRPKSPLVLHELRSSVEPSLSRQSSVQSQEEEGLSSNASVDSATLTRYSSWWL